jgi:predicted RNase H-like HicB family nuclease
VVNLANMFQRTYRVEFETDPKTKQVTAKLPTLNHTADFGESAEKALSNLRELATGLIEVLLDEGKEVPPSDTTGKGGVFLSLSVNVKPGPKANRAKK